MAKDDWDVIEVLRHNRHDWLNKLQLIKGNLDIGRIQKVESIINEIIQQSKNESDLSNLTATKIAERLLLFNWEKHPYVLSFETLVGDRDWTNKEDILLSILNDIFCLFDRYAKYGEDNSLTIILKDINGIELEMDYQGNIIIGEEWNNDIEAIRANYQVYIEKIEWDKDGCFFCLKFQD